MATVTLVASDAEVTAGPGRSPTLATGVVAHAPGGWGSGSGSLEPLAVHPP